MYKNKDKMIDKLDQLTFEADMLSKIMDENLKVHAEKEGITEVRYLSEIIREKFREIRAVF